MTIQRKGSHLGAQHPADERALPLKDLPYVLPTRATRDQRIPAIRTLTTGGITALDLKLLAVVQRALSNRLETFWTAVARVPDDTSVPSENSDASTDADCSPVSTGCCKFSPGERWIRNTRAAP